VAVWTGAVAPGWQTAVLVGAPSAALDGASLTRVLLDTLFFYCCRAHQDLHSFPTRRSSDLDRNGDLNHLVHRDAVEVRVQHVDLDRKSTRLNSSHVAISYAVFCLKKKTRRSSSPPSRP